jgi:peptidoglycan/xylan/chitin deacetylase (PgdA/CDA1 family)
MSLKHKLLAMSYPLLKIGNKLSLCMRKSNTGRLRVLVYHDISPFEVDAFTEQLRWLKRRWKFVDAQTYEAMVKGDLPIRGDNLLLTFDDGFISNRIIAETVLSKMGIRAIFFVVSGFIDISNPDDCHAFIAKGIRPDMLPGAMPTYWKNMCWDDLRYLINNGHTIGAHTATHARLSELTGNELDTEIIHSAELLESKLGVKVKHFAFTFGNFDSLSCEALSAARRRFEYIYTSLRGDNRYRRASQTFCRDTLSPLDSRFLMGAFLEGGADMLYKKSINAFNKCKVS